MKITALLFLIVSFTIPIFSNVPLQKAIDNGIRINSEIQNNDLEARILEVDNKIKNSNRYFSISGSAGYLYRSEKIDIKLPDLEIGPGMSMSGLTIGGGTNNNYDLSISLHQPIFTGNALSGMVKINELQKILNLSKRSFLELMLSGRIKTVFLNHQLLISQSNSLITLDKKISNHLKKLEDLYEEDLVGKSQVLETRLKYREISLSKEEVENNIYILASTFMELTGYRIKNIEKEHKEIVEDPETSIELFVRNHPNLRILSDQKKIINISKKITRGKDLPQIGGFAEFHYGVPGFNFLGDEWTSYFQGGLEIKIKVFDWGRSRKENIINDYKIEKLYNQEQDLVRRTRMRLAELYNTLKNLNIRTGTYNDMIAISNEESELKMMMFDEKQISNKDYLDSVLNVENLRSLKEKTSLQSDLIKVEINTMIGKKGEK
ncbi:MAG: TolC family protein [Candidatus Aminicenantes bacterium]|nr:TolC family protein [Candidatus Aminicenantes bacterium]